MSRRSVLAASVAVVLVTVSIGAALASSRTASVSVAVPTTSVASPDPTDPPTPGLLSSGPGVLDSTCEEVCVRSLLETETLLSGPEAAIELLRSWYPLRPAIASSCHGYHHVVGRAAANLDPPPLLHTDECQYGYLHGFLQGVAVNSADAASFVAAGAEYCLGYSEVDALGNCGHGLGHATAVAAPDDLLGAVAACAVLTDTLQGPCSGGVLMEYGDDFLRAKSWGSTENSASIDNAEEATSVAGVDLYNLCDIVPSFAQQECYRRLWMFLGPLSDPAFDRASEVCDAVEEPKLQELCQVGFGGFAVDVEHRSENMLWPPETPADADQVARRIVSRCQTFSGPGWCLYGAIVATSSHLFAAGFPDELIPPYCDYVGPDLADHCTEAIGAAMALGGID
jgi:hypothetical protein